MVGRWDVMAPLVLQLHTEAELILLGLGLFCLCALILLMRIAILLFAIRSDLSAAAERGGFWNVSGENVLRVAPVSRIAYAARLGRYRDEAA